MMVLSYGQIARMMSSTKSKCKWHVGVSGQIAFLLDFFVDLLQPRNSLSRAFKYLRNTVNS